MVEWLRVRLIGPMVAQLMALPAPLRYAALVFAALLLFYLIPWRWVVSLVSWPIKVLLHGLGHGGLAIQRLAGGKPYTEHHFDQVDRWSERVLHGLRAVFYVVEVTQAFLHQRLRLQKRWLFLLPVLVYGIYLVRPQLGLLPGTQLLDQGSEHVELFERWALVGIELPTQRESDEGDERDGQQPESETATPVLVIPTVVANPGESILNPLHTVQQGEILRAIAVRYGVSTRCIMQTNTARYPDQNWDSLAIGQELEIPLSDPGCRQ
jgi:hypothetical protein